METTESVSDNKEKTESPRRVLHTREEVGVKSERESGLRRSEKVDLEDRAVERDERFEDLGVVLVHDVLLDVSFELVSVEDFGGLEPSVGESGHELVAEDRVVVGHRERDVEEADLRDIST